MLMLALGFSLNLLTLLAMVLAPLFLGVPILLGLVWMWGTQGYQQLVSYKVSSDLVTAHEYFAHMHQTLAVDIAALEQLLVRFSELVVEHPEIAEIDMLHDVTKQVEGHTICALGDAAAARQPERLQLRRRAARIRRLGSGERPLPLQRSAGFPASKDCFERPSSSPSDDFLEDSPSLRAAS